MEKQEVVTIQKTSKDIKLDLLIGRIAVPLGLLIMFAGNGDSIPAFIGGAVVIYGVTKTISSRIRRWWHHD